MNRTTQHPGRESLFHDLHFRIISVALVPLLIAISLLAAYFAHREIKASWTALDLRGREVAQRLAETAAFGLFTGNDLYLKRLLNYERAAQRCETIGISDRTQRWRLVSGPVDILPPAQIVNHAKSWKAGNLIYFLYPVKLQKIVENDPYLESGGKPKTLGDVVVVLKIAPIEKARLQILFVTLGFTVFLLLAATWLAWRLSRNLTRPLNAIIAAVRDVARGDLNTRLKESSRGELGELERGINHMTCVMGRHAQEMEHRVQEATHELREQKMAAEAAVMARSRFLAAASHDLRQPMHALILLVEALKEKLRIAGGEPLRLSEHIEASAHSMESLLNALLDISKLDAGIVVAHPECFAVDTVFRRLVQQYAPLAAEKNVRLDIHSSRITLFTDPVLLERILSNLLANAIRYTDRGRIILGLRRVRRDWVRIEVCDTGKGIPKAFREKIFEEYFQLENPERDRDKGLGLGLAIVQRLARLLDSPVQVNSILGKGSRFSLLIARCEPPASAAETVAPEGEALDLGGGPPMVVILDDDEMILEAMAAVFDQWGIDPAVGVDARQIVQDLRELGRSPDAILSDYRLRDGRTGVEAIAELRAAFGTDIPAVLITGDTAPATIQAISNSGLPVLHKPLQPAKLRAYLNHMLSLRKEC